MKSDEFHTVFVPFCFRTDVLFWFPVCLPLWVFLFCATFSYAADTKMTKEVVKEVSNTQTAMVELENQSLLSCGAPFQMDVYTTLDVKLLLLLDQILTPNSVPLSTDWDHFLPPPIQFLNANEQDTSAWPKDMTRLVELCLIWKETNNLKLFPIADAILEKERIQIRKLRPWKNLPPHLALHVDRFSDGSLKEFIHIILRSHAYFSVRGGLQKNPSLWYIPFEWRTSMEDK